MSRPTVLFVCTHNSARSQMAEGLLRSRYGDRYEAYSAGTERTHVRPLAIEALREIGVDISDHESKTVEDLGRREFDYVVTVCDSARESCPYVPAREEMLHQSFPDPSAATGSEEEQLDVFRQVRDEIALWIDEAFGGRVLIEE
jgi:arsenate reductase (thioredoxin)